MANWRHAAKVFASGIFYSRGPNEYIYYCIYTLIMELITNYGVSRMIDRGRALKQGKGPPLNIYFISE